MAFLISLRTIPVRQGAEGGLLGPQSGAAQSEAKLFPKAWGPGQAGRSCRPVPDPGGTPGGQHLPGCYKETESFSYMLP